MYNNLLEKLGLSKEESEIYLYLIKNPQKNITDISKATNINRPKLYKILPAMEEAGLIGKNIEGKRTLYIAENPKILNTFLDNLKDSYETYVPEIEKIYNNSFDKPIFKHYRGVSGIRNIFLDIGNTLNKGDVFYRYSSRTNIEDTSIGDKEYDKYRKLRNQKQLQRYVITNEYLDSLKTKRLEKDVVVIPKKIDEFEDNITKIIYGNKVAIIDYNTNECIIIESQVFAHFEKKLFLMLFKFLK